VGKSYRDLVAWQKAMDLATAVYEISACFPREEIYGLTSQLRRAAVSVPSNIAEGQGRHGVAEFRHFLRQARPLMELEAQVLIAERLRYIFQNNKSDSRSFCRARKDSERTHEFTEVITSN
jgi:four helix bundle protein